MSGKAVIFSAPSGAGKTTIVQYLLRQNLNLAFSISATTRGKRPAEKDGRDYYFISVSEFKEKIQKDEFVEWEEVYDNLFYGTLKSEIEKVWAEGYHVIFDVDVVGGLSLKKYFGENALSIFVSPPDIEVLKERLVKRHTETPESIARRLAKADVELKYAIKFDYVLMNNDLKSAFEDATSVVSKYLSE